MEGGKTKSEWDVSLMDSELSTSTPISRRLQPRMRGNGAGRPNKGRQISWQNGSLKRNQGWTMAYSSMPERDGKNQ